MHIVPRRPSDAAPNRLTALAKLPVFYDLDGRRAVVAGGSPGAAWKAELLAAAGAAVEIYAEDPCGEMLLLVERGAAAGSLTLRRAPWSAEALSRAAIAVGDLASDEDAEAFARAARKAGIPVNVVDRPAYCDFQFGSIVNRSPVVIGISTDGAAPILAQAIRRRIETLLPPALAAWAAIAKTVRERACEMLSPGAQRRSFWERFSDLAFAGKAPRAFGGTVDALIDSVRAGQRGRTGRVTLVGAGPGDAELLTLKAVRALQSADVILYDDLVSNDVLELARREAKRMIVGKRGGRASCRQDDINELMFKLARDGKHVVRLKSGDPMIYGRAGEEIAELERLGIPVEVVPGITAAIGLAAALGVSLTHRDMAHSLRFVTGHSKAGEIPQDLDWHGLADPDTTTIFYMAGRTASGIAARLVERGLPGATPVVVASSISRVNQTISAGMLDDLIANRIAFDIDQPTLVGIGQVFARVAGRAATVPDLAERRLLATA